MDLSPLRSDPRAREVVKTVDDAQAQLRTDTLADAPKDVVWAVITDPALRTHWMEVERIDYKPGARHTKVGAEYHCIHDGGDTTVFRVAEALEPDRVTIAFRIMGVLVWWTTQLQEGEAGRTRIVSRLSFDPPKGIRGVVRGLAVKQVMKGYAKKYARSIARDAEELAKRGPIAAATV